MRVKKIFSEIFISHKKFFVFLLLMIIAISALLTRYNYQRIVSFFRPSIPITVTATGEPGLYSSSNASEIWILRVSVNSTTQNLSEISLNNGWEYHNGSLRSYANQPASLELFLPSGFVEIVFTQHMWSGIVSIEMNDITEEIDLFSHDSSQGLIYSVLNTTLPNTFVQVIRLFFAFILFTIIITIFIFVLILIMKFLGVNYFFIILIMIFTSVNFAQFKSIDNFENYTRGDFASRHEMTFMQALHNTNEPDIARSAVEISHVWRRLLGMYVDIGYVCNNVNIIVPSDYREYISIDPITLITGNIGSIEKLDYNTRLLANLLLPTLDLDYNTKSNEIFPDNRQYRIIYNPKNDYVKELIILSNYDDMIIFLDMSLLTADVYLYIEELR